MVGIINSNIEKQHGEAPEKLYTEYTQTLNELVGAPDRFPVSDKE
jgi:hypothetical protein